MNYPNTIDLPLVVFGHADCGWALALRRILDHKHVEYEWRDIKKGSPRFGAELRRLARGQLSVPTVVFPDGSVMVEPLPKQVLDKLRD